MKTKKLKTKTENHRGRKEPIMIRLIILGIIIGVLIMLAVKNVIASNYRTIFSDGDAEVIKVVDGNVNCYFSKWRIVEAISCVKVK